MAANFQVGLEFCPHLLDITSADQISRDLLLGGLFENLVVIEALKARYNSGRDGRLYFMRDKNGNEVDLVVENHRQLSFIEIKSSQTPNEEMAHNMHTLRKATGVGDYAYIIYSGESWPLKDCDGFINFRATSSIVTK